MGWIIFKYAAGLGDSRGDSAECVCTSLITSWSSGVCIWQVSRFQFEYLPQSPGYLKCVDSIHSLNPRGITEFGFNPKMKLLLWSPSSILQTPDIGPWWDLMTCPGYLQYRGHSPSPLSSLSAVSVCNTIFCNNILQDTGTSMAPCKINICTTISTSSCDKCCDTDLGQVSAD